MRERPQKAERRRGEGTDPWDPWRERGHGGAVCVCVVLEDQRLAAGHRARVAHVPPVEIAGSSFLARVPMEVAREVMPQLRASLESVPPYRVHLAPSSQPQVFEEVAPAMWGGAIPSHAATPGGVASGVVGSVPGPTFPGGLACRWLPRIPCSLLLNGVQQRRRGDCGDSGA